MPRPGARRAGVMLALAVTGLTAVAPALARGDHARANLVVSGGSVNAHGRHIAGSFTVRNRGAARAPRSQAKLFIRVSRHNSWEAGRFPVVKLAAGGHTLVRFAGSEPQGLPSGTFMVTACADTGHAVTESLESDNCRALGRITVPATTSGGGGRVPPDPISFEKDQVFALTDSQSNYWVFVPDAYDSSNQTPIELFVWMHGCGGEGSGDIYTISPGEDQSYIAVSLGGREDDCWDPDTDQAKVLAAVSDIETHFNIDRHRIVLGGYSSGGDLAYRTAFYHSSMFAGLLAENTSPFRDTGSTAAASLAAATTTFHIVQLAHLQDDTYPIDGVRNEIAQVQAAGFPVQLIERPGDHYDDSTDSFGTDHDLQTYLLPHLDDGWRSP